MKYWESAISSCLSQQAMLEVESQFWPWEPVETGQFFSIGRQAQPRRVWKVGESFTRPRPARVSNYSRFCLRAVFGSRKFWMWNPSLSHGIWRRRTVLSHRKESMEPSPLFWGQTSGDPCEATARQTCLAIFLWEQSLDIRNFSMKSKFWP